MLIGAGCVAKVRPGLKAVSNLGVMNSDNEARVRPLESVHPSRTAEGIQGQTGFAIRIPANVLETARPTAEVLRIIHELDPDRVWWSEFREVEDACG
jgi:acyl CoA:acetate/3-ketoacid CoA transferase beta subunit